MTKARAPPRHSLGRNLLRGREAVPQDVAEVQPTRRAHEDPEHVHLGEGQATGSLSSQPSCGRGGLPAAEGTTSAGTEGTTEPRRRSRSAAFCACSSHAPGTTSEEMPHARHTRERRTSEAGWGHERRAQSHRARAPPGHTRRGLLWR